MCDLVPDVFLGEFEFVPGVDPRLRGCY